MWCDGPGTPSVLPAGLAAPWCAVAAALDMPPVLVYATYNLANWRRLDPAAPVQLGNICCLHNFLGGIGERGIWRQAEGRLAASAHPTNGLCIPCWRHGMPSVAVCAQMRSGSG